MPDLNLLRSTFFWSIRMASLLPMILFLYSCSPEYKLAKSYRENAPEFRLMVKPPTLVYKYNHKGEEIDSLNQMSAGEQDSALFYSSRFIRYLSDSVLLERYVNSFADELRMLGFKVVIGTEPDSELLEFPQAYLVDLSQIQIDEYYYPYEDQEYFMDTLYFKSFDLNAIDFSVWVELSKIGSDGSSKVLLYSTHPASDDLDGSFILDPFRQNISYSYDYDSLTVDAIYDLSRLLGRLHASYLYDFFLNQYILVNLPQGMQPWVYYHYNRFRDSYVFVDEERFEILEPN